MAEVASAYVSLMPSAKGFGSKLNSQVGPEISQSGKKQGLSFGKLFAAGAALGIGAKAFSFLGDSLGEAREAAVIGARTENVIKSMGNAANISASQVGNLAASLSNKTAIDDEAIQAGQNMLLTFGQVRNEVGKGNDIFNQTSRLMVDMSVAMGGDAKSAALQLGKALNDPTKGVTALARAGVSFTQQQKDSIKAMQESGDMLGAQKIVLGEVQKQFGGAAESMATPADKAKVSIGNLKEQIGTALLPSVDKATTKFSEFVTEMQTGEGAGGKVASAFKKVASNLDTIAPVLGTVAAGMLLYKVASLSAAAAAAIQAAGTSAATGATWSLNAALRANPIGIVVTAITLLAAGLVLAYKKSDTFRAIVDKAFAVVKKGAIALWEKGIKPGFALMVIAFQAVGKAGTWLWNNALQPAFKFIVGGVANVLDMWSQMLGVLAKVPGFGWAKGAADALSGAAGKAREFADGIKKIPTSKTVTITTIYKATGVNLPSRMNKDTDNSLPFAPRLGIPAVSDQTVIATLNQYGAAGQELMSRVAKGIKDASPKTIKAAQVAFGKIEGVLTDARDNLRTTLDGLKSDFASLADSVAQAFTGDLFGVTATEAAAGVAGRTVGENFFANLMAKRGELTGLMASFTTLKGWGLDPSFLSQLFASGNGALITELAGMGQADALVAGQLFTDVTNLGAQLGGAVATNDPVTSRIDETNRLLTTVSSQLGYLGSDIGKELNGVAAKAQRDKKNKKGRK